MAYRGDWTCHICGERTSLNCPVCGEGVCEAHTLSGRIEEAQPARRADGDRLAARLGGGHTCTECIERHLAESQGAYVTIWEGHDPLLVEVYMEALRDAGFDARAIGSRTAMLIGAGPFAFKQYLEVPEGQAEAAAELVHALASASPVYDDQDDEDQDDEDQDDEDDEQRSRRKVRFGYRLLVGGVLAVGVTHVAEAGLPGLFLSSALVILGAVELVRGLTALQRYRS